MIASHAQKQIDVVSPFLRILKQFIFSSYAISSLIFDHVPTRLQLFSCTNNTINSKHQQAKWQSLKIVRFVDMVIFSPDQPTALGIIA